MKKVDFCYFMYLFNYILCLVSVVFLPVSLVIVAFNPYLFWLGLVALVWFLFSLGFYQLFYRYYEEVNNEKKEC